MVNRLKIKFKRTSSSSKNLSLQFENSETCDAWKAKIEQLMTADKPSLDQYTEPLRFLNPVKFTIEQSKLSMIIITSEKTEFNFCSIE